MYLAVFYKFYKLLHSYRTSKFSESHIREEGTGLCIIGATVLAKSHKNARHARQYGMAGQSRQPLGLSPNVAMWCLRVFWYPQKPQIGILQLVHLTPPLLQSPLLLVKGLPRLMWGSHPFCGFSFWSYPQLYTWMNAKPLWIYKGNLQEQFQSYPEEAEEKLFHPALSDRAWTNHASPCYSLLWLSPSLHLHEKLLGFQERCHRDTLFARC